jgi:hypothetical protein
MGPAWDVRDSATADTETRWNTRPAAHLPRPADEDGLEHEERAHGETIDQRDAAEEALSQAYYLITGRSPEWSNVFGYSEALEEIDDAQRLLRQATRSTPSGDGRKTVMGWARRLSEWRAEHHDCDCPIGPSCGCRELRDLTLEIECSTISDAEFERMAQDDPVTPSGDELVEALKKCREFAVLFIAFDGRDRNTPRMEKTLDSLVSLALEADEIARQALAQASRDGGEQNPGVNSMNGDLSVWEPKS